MLRIYPCLLHSHFSCEGYYFPLWAVASELRSWKYDDKVNPKFATHMAMSQDILAEDVPPRLEQVREPLWYAHSRVWTRAQWPHLAGFSAPWEWNQEITESGRVSERVEGRKSDLTMGEKGGEWFGVHLRWQTGSPPPSPFLGSAWIYRSFSKFSESSPFLSHQGFSLKKTCLTEKEEVAFSLPQRREGIQGRKGKRWQPGGGMMRKWEREERKEPEEEERAACLRRDNLLTQLCQQLNGCQSSTWDFLFLQTHGAGVSLVTIS